MEKNDIPYQRFLVVVALMFCLTWPVFASVKYLWVASICENPPNGSGKYSAYCGDKRVGDLEHQVLYFGLRGAGSAIREADVLFVGSSVVQFAFSHPNVEPFFAKRKARFFLMGLGHGERWQFAQAIVRRHAPKPKIAVINVNPFFESGVSEPAGFVLDHPVASYIDALFRLVFQRVSAAACEVKTAAVPFMLCGRVQSLDRLEATGQWDNIGYRNENNVGGHPVRPTAAPSKGQMTSWLEYAEPAARQFFASLAADCIVLIDTPRNGPVGTYARHLADHFGTYLIQPELPDLRTMDGRHLDFKSAVAWSNAFLAELDAVGRKCGAWQ